MEIEEIVRTRKQVTYLSITGMGMPPVSLSTESPFGEGYDKDLALENHYKCREARI